MPPDRTAPVDPSAAYRRYVLVALVVVYAFNFVDRQIIGILAVPMRRELGLTDTALGLLGGTAFALFYSVLAIPAARLADRTGRRTVISVALALWSAFTAACGLAPGFGTLLALRVGVGVGEAGGVSPAHALLCDYYPPHARGRALALYSLGIPLGSAAGIAAGGMLAAAVNWRYAFACVGLAGLALAPLFHLTVREPRRGRLDAPDDGAPAEFGATLAFIARRSSFWLLATGAGFASMAGYGLFFWLPSLLVRSHGCTVREAGLAYAALLLVGGVAGLWLGGRAADALGRRRRAWYAWVPALAFAAALPLYALGVTQPGLRAALLVLVLPTALGLAWLGPLQAAVQQIVPPAMRATASALFLWVNNLLGLGLGSLLIGALSDALRARYGTESLRIALLAVLTLYAVAALLLWRAGRDLERDWRAR